MLKCQCGKPATYRLHQTVGKKQKIHACSDHAPTWAKEGKPNKFYVVSEL